jgi:hypothetical protein
MSRSTRIHALRRSVRSGSYTPEPGRIADAILKRATLRIQPIQIELVGEVSGGEAPRASSRDRGTA